jgi:phenylalanyl-tRNA synthetase alpha subunit
MFSDLTDQLRALGARLAEALDAANDHAALESARIRFLGRSGEITLVRRTIGTLPAAERPAAGKTINDAVAEYEAQFVERARALDARALEGELALAIDVTFPGHGSAHRIAASRSGARWKMRAAISNAAGSPSCSATRSKPNTIISTR